MSKGLGKMQLAILERLRQGWGAVPNRSALPAGTRDLNSLRWQMARDAGIDKGGRGSMTLHKNREYQSFNASFHRATRRLREDGYLLPVEGFPATFVKMKPHLRLPKSHD
ncbi:MAG: hypothetical protein EOP10_18430 [Proteobacteria bacterium]|nr:MAG: hypothetical protein EOP10_18430 [Pseudomonadota bacterium]